MRSSTTSSAVHDAGDDPDVTSGQLLGLLVGQVRCGVGEQRDVRRPLPKQQGLVHGPRSGAEHADGLVPDLPPVAVRAVQHVAAPLLPYTGNVGQLVDQPGGHQQPPRGDEAAVVEGDVEPVRGAAHALGLAGQHQATVVLDLLAAGADQLGRADAVAGQEPVHPRGGGVARRSGIDHDHGTPGPPQGHRRAQAGGTTADHRDIARSPVSDGGISNPNALT